MAQTPALDRRESRPRPAPPAAGPPTRLPPQDLEAEMALLGSMMLDREAVGLVLQIVPLEESTRLYRPDHRKLFEILVEIYDANKAMDLIVVRDELERRGALQDVGGIAYLTELVESVPSAVHAEHYARIVRDKSLLRDLIACAGQILEQAYEHRDDAQDVLDGAEKLLFEVTEKRIRNPAIQIKDLLAEVYSLLERPGENYITGVRTGFLELDDITCGFQPGELIIIAARPSMGKTALGLSIADHIAVEDNKPVVFFSMEMARQQIAYRLLCARARVDSHKLRRGMLAQQDIDAIQFAIGQLQEAKLFLDDTPGMSVMELRAKSRRLKMTHDVQMIIVDYLQLMSDPRTARESRQHEIATISRGLKALARELRIPVVALCQVNRNPEGREGNRPRMSDLRESGAIEQDADTIILLHREEYYLKEKLKVLESSEMPDDDEGPRGEFKGGAGPDRKEARLRGLRMKYEEAKGKAELIVAKQRNGPTGTVDVAFNQAHTSFHNLYHGAEPSYVPPDSAEPPVYENTPVPEPMFQPERNITRRPDGRDDRGTPF